MDDDSIKTAADLFGTIKGARCMVSNVKDPSLLISLIEFGSTHTTVHIGQQTLPHATHIQTIVASSTRTLQIQIIN